MFAAVNPVNRVAATGAKRIRPRPTIERIQPFAVKRTGTTRPVKPIPTAILLKQRSIEIIGENDGQRLVPWLLVRHGTPRPKPRGQPGREEGDHCKESLNPITRCDPLRSYDWRTKHGRKRSGARSRTSSTVRRMCKPGIPVDRLHQTEIERCDTREARVDRLCRVRCDRADLCAGAHR